MLQGVPILPRMQEPVTHEFTLAEVRAIHDLPIPELIWRAQQVHREHHPAGEVQLCSLLSVKTGGCPEDCSYCTQSSRYETGLEKQRMMTSAEVLDAAARAKDAGATRFCMGAAWREVKDGPGIRRCAGDGSRGQSAGHGSVLHAGHAHRVAGAAAGRGRALRLQPQPRHVAIVLQVDHHHAHLRRPPAHASPTCARPASPSARAASSAWASRWTIAAGCWRRWRTWIRSRRACRSTRWRPCRTACARALSDRPRIDPLELVRMIATARILMPQGARAAVGGARRADARGADALFPRGRQLGLLRREAADHRQPRRRGRPRAAARRRPARRAARRRSRSPRGTQAAAPALEAPRLDAAELRRCARGWRPGGARRRATVRCSSTWC